MAASCLYPGSAERQLISPCTRLVGAGGEATHREGTGRARGLRAKRRRPGAAWYHRALVALCVEIVRGPGEPGTESRATRASAGAARATARPTIPAPSHLLDKVVKRHHSSTTNIVTLKLSNLFVVNEHTDGRQYCTNETQKPNQFAHHSDSGWQSSIAQEKKTF